MLLLPMLCSNIIYTMRLVVYSFRLYPALVYAMRAGNAADANLA